MINITQNNQRIIVSHFDEQGEIQFSDIEIPDSELYVWEYSNKRGCDATFQSWDGKSVRKVKRNKLDKFRIEEFLINAPTEFIDTIHRFNLPKKYFIDIEVEVNDEFPSPDLAKEPVTTIAIANEHEGITVLGTKKMLPEIVENIRVRLNDYLKAFNREITFAYHYFPSENSMLYYFFSKLIKKMPLITGWNVIGYDWKYLVNRCRNLNIDPAIASPSNFLIGKDELPQDRLIVDYMEIYKKWDTVVDIKESISLDHVSNKVLGIQKVKYKGTLQTLYRDDFELYVFYNAVDAYLVRLLDEKLNTMLTFLKLGDLAHVEANKAFSPIWVTEALMCREFYKRHKIFVTSKDFSNKKRGSFEGGYVSKPITGLHEWVACFDFASLYPSTMRQFNISPESFLGMSAKDSTEVLDGMVKTASGALFDMKQDSVMRILLTDIYAKRKESKQRATIIEKEIENLKQLLK